MGTTRMASARKTALGFWLQQTDPILTLPGNGSGTACRIVVPFKHKIIDAYLYANSIEKTGTVTVTLKRVTVGATGDGSAIGTSLTGATLPTLADLVSKIQIPLAQADKGDQPATKEYVLTLTGTDPDDLIKFPTLAILVIPVPRNAL